MAKFLLVHGTLKQGSKSLFANKHDSNSAVEVEINDPKMAAHLVAAGTVKPVKASDVKPVEAKGGK